jgi:urocanate hydratase
MTLSNQLPDYPIFIEGIRRAPDRGFHLNEPQAELALKNALRYIPSELQAQLAPEFLDELRTNGRIYGYRYRPQGDIRPKPIDAYEGNCIEGKAFQVMMDNNLCFDIALYPYELVTYGETGQVCQNWMQYRLIKQYLQVMTREQTLVVESGHPLGLFKSHPNAPRVIITNSMMVGMYDNRADWEIAAQMGVANYGQAFTCATTYKQEGKPYSIAFHGNIIALLEYAETHAIAIDLLSDQTSCHAVYEGGYCPAGISFEARTRLLKDDRSEFRRLADISLQRHFEVIRKLVAKGTYFFDYGNSFMKAIYDAGVKAISRNGSDEKDGFIWPSYVEDIMGPELFDYGYGPFRWVCLSGMHEDLIKTDHAAMSCIDPERRGQDRDNYNWIRDAEKNRLVVGTQARILYSDAEGRLKIALRFNEMVRNGETGPIMLGHDHHDVSGTDSPFRETANIKAVTSLFPLQGAGGILAHYILI